MKIINITKPFINRAILTIITLFLLIVVSALFTANQYFERFELSGISQEGVVFHGNDWGRSYYQDAKKIVIADIKRHIPFINNLYIVYYIDYTFREGKLNVNARLGDESTFSSFDSAEIKMINIRTNTSSKFAECWGGIRSLPYAEFTVAVHINPVGPGEWWQHFYVKTIPFHEIEIISENKRSRPGNR